MTAPDGLQVERTSLAWLRFCLSLLVATAALARLAAHASIPLAVGVASTALPLSIAVSVLAGARFRRSRTLASAPRDGTLPACVTALVCLLGLAAIGYVLTGS